MAARHPSASMTLENCADELFEAAFTGHNDIDLAEWLGVPIAGQPAYIELVENFHMSVEGDAGMAGAPADSDSTIPATDEEVHAMLYPRAIGNQTNAESVDDDPLRGSPRDAGDLSERIQSELGYNAEFQYTSVAPDRSSGSPRRLPSRLPLIMKKKYHDDPCLSPMDDEDDLGYDDRMVRRGRAPSPSPDRVRA
eukprot:2642643-Pyramimonas_sp.AAC.1